MNSTERLPFFFFTDKYRKDLFTNGVFLMRFDNFLIESVEDKGILKAVFLAGSPGAGKSYVSEKLKIGSIEPRVINVDKLFGLLDDTYTRWSAMQSKVTALTKKKLFLHINSLLPMVIDGTSSDTGYLIRRNGLLESIGYDTAMLYVDTSLDTALERNRRRERQVPEDVLRDMHNRVNENKKFYRSKFSTFIEVRNDQGELNDRELKKIIKFSTSFFMTPISNPIGKDIIQKLKSCGEKYYTPTIVPRHRLEELVKIWYGREG